MIKRPMEIEPLDEWAKENGMDIVFLYEEDLAYIPEIDLTIEFDGVMYTLKDEIKVYNKKYDIQDVVKELEHICRVKEVRTWVKSKRRNKNKLMKMS